MNARHAVWLLPYLLLMPMLANAAESNEIKALKQQLKFLTERIQTLEQQQVMNANNQPATPAAPIATTTAENTGNPSISVIGTFAGAAMRGSNAVHQNSFFPLSEGEFVFGADVDAHTRVDVTVTGNNAGLAIEEGYLTAHLPHGFRLRAGRKFIPLGRSNAVHPHALIYADIPNGLVNLFGAQKLTGEGVFVDHPWYIGDSVHSLLLGFFQNNNNVAFDTAANNRFAGTAHWTGMWDLNDATTLELGSTYVLGRNGIAGSSTTHLFGGHIALKNAQLDHSGWSLQGEWNESRIHKGSLLPNTTTDGAYILGEYDINRNWLVFSRYDYSHMTGATSNESAYSLGADWKLSEFQSITLQLKHTRHALAGTAAQLGLTVGSNANEALLRWVVAIGPHRPHSY